MSTNRYEGVDAILDDGDEYDAYLHVGDEDDENLYYLSEFDAPDPFTLLRTQEGTTVLLVSTLEHGRARKESNADEVRNTNEFFDGDRRGDPELEEETAIWSSKTGIAAVLIQLIDGGLGDAVSV